MTAPERAAADGRPPVDLRLLLPATLPEQGMRPLCLPFALTGAHDAILYGTGGPFAPEPVWWQCTRLGQTSQQGVLLQHAADALASVGQTTSALWPYDRGLGYGTENPPTGCGQPPWQQAAWQLIPLAHDGVEDDIEDMLAARRPVVLVVEVTDEFADPEPDGHVPVPLLTAAPGDYHAVLAVGVATDAAQGRRLLIRNSWGPAWGAGGYCWLPLAYLVAFVAQAAVVSR